LQLAQLLWLRVPQAAHQAAVEGQPARLTSSINVKPGTNHHRILQSTNQMHIS
jgi:hypothetical protein